MEGLIVPGLPPEWGHVVTVLIGLLSGWLVYPATAIAKKLGQTHGPGTVTIAAFLSLLVGAGYAGINAMSGGTFSVTQAITVAVIAFFKANGEAIARAQAADKAAREKAEEAPRESAPSVTVNVPAPAPQSPVTPPPGIEAGKPLPAEYVEPQTARKAPSLRIEK